jgi:hypothetical protein
MSGSLIEHLEEFAAREAALTDAERAERAERIKQGVAMQAKFGPLAVYNAEVARGIMHTAEYAAAMAQLQREFDERPA